MTFPQAWRGVMAGALLMWGRGISEFGAVVILAYNPKVISVLTFERFEGFGLRARSRRRCSSSSSRSWCSSWCARS